MRNFLVLFLLCPLLAACMGILEPKPELDLISRGFTESMRWSDFPAAAGYVDRDARDEFLVQFTEDEDLHIVDSTILSMDSLQEDQATLVYVLEYYRLPSGKINKWRWEQQWQLVLDGNGKTAAWLIKNEPPVLPWKK